MHPIETMQIQLVIELAGNIDVWYCKRSLMISKEFIKLVKGGGEVLVCKIYFLIINCHGCSGGSISILCLDLCLPY